MVFLSGIILWVLCSSKEEMVQYLVCPHHLEFSSPSFSHQNVVETLDAVHHCRNRMIFQVLPYTKTTSKHTEQLLLLSIFVKVFRVKICLFYTSLPTTMWFSRGSDLYWFCSLIHSVFQDTSLEHCWHTQALNKYLININMCKTNDYVYMFEEKYKNEVTSNDEIKLHPKRYDSYKKKKM